MKTFMKNNNKEKINKTVLVIHIPLSEYRLKINTILKLSTIHSLYKPIIRKE
jgi:hypothetical protein